MNSLAIPVWRCRVSSIDTLFTNAKFADGSINDIAIARGRIAAVSPVGTLNPAGAPARDLGGALVVPGFVEGHIHLDTSFYGDAWKPHKPCRSAPRVHGFGVLCSGSTSVPVLWCGERALRFKTLAKDPAPR